MADVIDGAYGRLLLSGWIGQTPDGAETGFLLVTTPDGRAPATMPVVAGALGLDPAAGSMTTVPDGGVRVEVGQDDWATLVLPEVERWSRPVGEEWARLSRRYGKVVLTVGYIPMAAGLDPQAYVDQVLATGQYALGLVAVAAQGD